VATVEPVPRQVIERKLSAILDDKDKVAIVVNETELRLLIEALHRIRCRTAEQRRLLTGLQDLLGAFLGE
jgi:hypothetical protein